MKKTNKITLDMFEGRNPAEQMLTYIFKEVMPQEGYRLRKSQLALAKKILSTLMHGRTALCEAEVGTGKTHAYLIASLIYRMYLKNEHEKGRGITEAKHKRPITIATASISLQKSIVDDYIPAISNMLEKHGIIDKPLAYVVRKGKEHYICDMRLVGYANSLEERDESTVSTLEKIRTYGWKNIDLGNVSNLNKYAKSMICVPQTCSGEFCKMHGKCRYSKLKEYFDSEDIDIQITNLNYYLADAIRRGENLTPLLRDPCALIFDEAHLLVGVARSMYGKSFQNTTINKISEYVQDLHITNSRLSMILYDDSEKLKELNDKFFSLVVKKARENAMDEDAERYAVSIHSHTLRGYLFSLKQLLEKIANELRCEMNISERSVRKAKYVGRLCRMTSQKIEWMLSARDLIFWLDYPKATQKTSNQMSICGMPKNIPDLLYANVWSSATPKVLTSGTLSIGGDFTHTKKMTGINLLAQNRVVECTYESPFDYELNTVMYFSENVPFPNGKDKEYINGLADELERLIRTTHGHTLVLFTSYRTMDITYGIIKERIPDIPIMMMSKGNLIGIKEYRESGNGVLFATGSCWEGIDIPGDILSSLIIVKLPFPTPDPILDYEKSLYSSEEDFKNHVVVPQMQIKIKQGCGRLIRTEKDQGVISILDSRCRPGGKYYDDVMRAVRSGKKTSDIKTVRAFIEKVKTPDYFA